MFVYLLLNKINGKWYIGKWEGQTLQDRLDMHVSHARAGSPHKINRAIRKYGSENFAILPLFETTDKFLLAAKEIELIASWQAQDDRFGYNMTAGGEGVRLLNAEAEQRRREGIRRSKLGSRNPNFGKSTWNSGLRTGPQSTEHKRRRGVAISITQTGMKKKAASPERKQRIAVAIRAWHAQRKERFNAISSS